jgi:hypothetical protein
MTESLARIQTVVKRVVLDQQMGRFSQLYAIIAYDNPDCGDARAIHRRVRLNGFKAIAAATLLLPGFIDDWTAHRQSFDISHTILQPKPGAMRLEQRFR